MSVKIFVPTWCTFNKIPAGTPTAGLAALNTALGTSLSVGDTNPVWPDLQDLDLGGGPLTRGQSLTDLSKVTEIENANFLSYAQIQLAVAVGGEVEDMPLWFVISENDYGNDVPSSLPNSTKQVENGTDENGEPIFETASKSWEEWNEVAHSGPWDGNYYIPSSAGNRYWLKASQVVPLGLNVITRPEFLALQASNQPAEPV